MNHPVQRSCEAITKTLRNFIWTTSKCSCLLSELTLFSQLLSGKTRNQLYLCNVFYVNFVFVTTFNTVLMFFAGYSHCLVRRRQLWFGSQFPRKGWLRWDLGKDLPGKLKGWIGLFLSRVLTKFQASFQGNRLWQNIADKIKYSHSSNTLS